MSLRLHFIYCRSTGFAIRLFPDIEGDSKVTFGHPQTSFFETIDEQSAIVLAQIAEVRIRKNF